MDKNHTLIIQRDGAWVVATCAEVPGANGQGRTKAECLESLRLAVELIRDDQRQGPTHSVERS